MLRVHALPPLIQFRSIRWGVEGYIGWKPMGHFGLALRPANSPMM